MESERKKGTNHLVLVHGAGHGAWCWYKVATLLRSGGYRVTALDLAASGTDTTRVEDVLTFADYARPLLDMMRELPAGERVILIGHSYGGIVLALAMDMFPEKVAAAVFVAAFRPDTASPPSYVAEKCSAAITWMDSQITSFGEDNQRGSFLFGPQFLQQKLYQLCPPEDVTLATTLVRPMQYYKDEAQMLPPMSESRYGAVDAFYVVCSRDLVILEEHQRWMIERSPVKAVKTIDTDHMAMLSAPKELYQCLHDIASAYA